MMSGESWQDRYEEETEDMKVTRNGGAYVALGEGAPEVMKTMVAVELQRQKMAERQLTIEMALESRREREYMRRMAQRAATVEKYRNPAKKSPVARFARKVDNLYAMSVYSVISVVKWLFGGEY